MPKDKDMVARRTEVRTSTLKTVPDPEVPAKAKRRKFTAAYKLRVLAEADGCTGLGEIGRLLRREGLYSSHLSDWRRARQRGSLRALAPKKRGRKPRERNPCATARPGRARQSPA